MIKAHGSSDARAIRSAVRQAMEAVDGHMTEALQQDLSRIKSSLEM